MEITTSIDSCLNPETDEQGNATPEEINRILKKSKDHYITWAEFNSLPEEEQEWLEEHRESNCPIYEKPGADGKRAVIPEEFDDILEATRKAYQSNEHIQRWNCLMLRVLREGCLKRSSCRENEKGHLLSDRKAIEIIADERYVEVNEELNSVLQEYTSELENDDYIFQGGSLRYHGPQPGGSGLSNKFFYKWMTKIRPILVEECSWEEEDAEDIGFSSIRKCGALDYFRSSELTDAEALTLAHQQLDLADIGYTADYLGITLGSG